MFIFCLFCGMWRNWSLYFFSRIGENLEQSLPNLKELVLTSNNIQELVSLLQFCPDLDNNQSSPLLIWLEMKSF